VWFYPLSGRLLLRLADTWRDARRGKVHDTVRRLFNDPHFCRRLFSHPVALAHSVTMMDQSDHRLTPAIEFKRVYKYYDDKPVLKNISFSVRRGETKIILGGSGSGKSTILKLIVGLFKPDEGEIWVDGEEISSYRETQLIGVRKKI